MSLTELMSSAGLSSYAEVALVLFFVAFLVIMWRIFSPSRKKELEDLKHLPLDDSSTPSRGRRTS